VRRRGRHRAVHPGSPRQDDGVGPGSRIGAPTARRSSASTIRGSPTTPTTTWPRSCSTASAA
jgi:hypothetical protein